MADADGCGNGFRFVDHVAAQERRGAGGLVADHHRPVVAELADGGELAVAMAEGAGVGGFVAGRAGRFGVADPVRGDVAGIANRQAVVIRSAAQGFDDLEGRGLLALQAERVDRVDDGDRGVVGDFLHQPHAVIEVALNLQHLGAMNHGLRQLAERDLAVGNQHEAGDAGAGRISRRRRRGVAGGGADDGPAARLDRLGHRHGHAAILEGAGGVQALEFHEQLDVLADQPGNVDQLNQRRVALVKADGWRLGGDGQAAAVFVDEAGVAGGLGHLR